MKLTEMEEKDWMSIRDDDILMIEDKEDTKRITVGDFKKYLEKSMIAPKFSELMNDMLKRLSEALVGADVSYVPPRIKFKDDWFTFSEEGEEPRWNINYEAPVGGKYELMITDLATNQVYFRMNGILEKPDADASFPWLLRDYSSLSALADSEKELSGLTFDEKNGEYIYAPGDAELNEAVRAIEENNDSIVLSGTNILVEINCSSLYIQTVYEITTTDVAAMIR